MTSGTSWIKSEEVPNLSNQWTYDQARGVYCCAYPGCKYETPNLGAMHLHWRKKDHAALLAGDGDPAKASGTGDGKPAPRTCPDCGRREFRLLQRSDPDEAEALSLGYRAVCINCRELVK